MRTTFIGRTFRAGCFECHGDAVHWTAKNSQGVAARHHDATGHETWCEIDTAIRYGGDDTAADAAKEES